MSCVVGSPSLGKSAAVDCHPSSMIRKRAGVPPAARLHRGAEKALSCRRGRAFSRHLAQDDQSADSSCLSQHEHSSEKRLQTTTNEKSNLHCARRFARSKSGAGQEQIKRELDILTQEKRTGELSRSNGWLEELIAHLFKPSDRLSAVTLVSTKESYIGSDRIMSKYERSFQR